MIKNFGLVVAFALLSTGLARADEVPDQMRAVWESAVERCVTYVVNGDDPMEGWTATPVRLPGAYSRYDRFERVDDDISVVLATRAGHDMCRMIRLGNDRVDLYPESIDRLMFDTFLPVQEMSIGGVTFAPDEGGVLTSCINQEVYELTPDFVVRTGNITISLKAAAIKARETRPC